MLRFQAEWERQSAVVIAWPYAGSDWSRRLARVEPEFVAFAGAILQRQSLIVLCRSRELSLRVRSLLAETADIARLLTPVLPYNDTWVRDYGPLTCAGSEGAALLDFRFDGWGGKYQAGDDDLATRRLHQAGLFGATEMHRLPWTLEGGSVETDGAGTLLTTHGCLIGASRNPSLDQPAMEAMLRETLGIERCLWLHHGYLPGDDTDGHVDTLARFCSRDTIAFVGATDANDSTFTPLLRMREELTALRQANGAPYRLIELPSPAPVFDAKGQRLPAGYANFLIINDAVLVPTYADPMDEVACARLAVAFPDRDIVALPSRVIIEQYGSLHCLSMQIPDTVTLHPEAIADTLS